MARLTVLAVSLASLAALAAPAAAGVYNVYEANRIAGLPVTPYLPSDRSCRADLFRCAVRAWDAQGTEAGLRRFRQAAAEGSVPAMRTLGLIYLRGERDAPMDVAQALGWFHEAAKRGDGASMYALGIAFEQGVGVEADPALARYWIGRAAAAGYGRAERAVAQRPGSSGAIRNN